MIRGRWARSALVPLVCLNLLGAGVAPAFAGELELTGSEDTGGLRFRADPGEANRLSVALLPGRRYEIRDAGAPLRLTPGLTRPFSQAPPCVNMDVSTVRCPSVFDELAFFLGDGDDSITLPDRYDRLSGVVYADPSDARAVDAGAGADRLTGSRLAGDRLFGGEGDDTVSGRGGRDRVNGGPGRDQLSGGAGDDTIGGGSGRDRLLGGSGNDHFLAADGERDVGTCGSGRDRGVADRRDRLSACEGLRRPRLARR